MLYYIMSALSLAVILAFSFVSFVLRADRPNTAVTMLHGLLMCGATVLLWLFLVHDRPGAAEAVVLLIVACGSALILFAREFGLFRVPRWLVVTHNIFSIIGLMLLLVLECSRNVNM